jgi:hypothetical protein
MLREAEDQRHKRRDAIVFADVYGLGTFCDASAADDVARYLSVAQTDNILAISRRHSHIWL